MTTPVISKKQQRRSLSAKKGPIKGLRNVLGQPYENYWPLLREDPESQLETLLKKLLVVLKRTSKSVPWSELRNMSKEERLAAKEAAKKTETDNDADKMGNVIFGINAITRALERKELCCVLIDSNVDPTLLVKHIVQMSQKQNIPVLLTTFLKRATVESVGFASAAFGLKRIVQNSSENHFYELFKKISLLFDELPTPKVSVSLFEKSDACDRQSDENMSCDEDVANLNQQVRFTDIYVYRSSKRNRAFEPPKSKDQKTDKEKLNDLGWGDFIAIDRGENVQLGKVDTSLLRCRKNSDDSDENEVKYTTKYSLGEKTVPSKKVKFSEHNYVPLKVKKVKGNIVRTKATKTKKKKK